LPAGLAARRDAAQMLQRRRVTRGDRFDAVQDALSEIREAHGVTARRAAGDAQTVVLADLDDEAADPLVKRLHAVCADDARYE
jgi:hypothetical protein